MKVTLADTSADFIKYSKIYFEGLDIEYHTGNIMEVEADVLVSPANSFGDMKGGIDLVYLQSMGYDVEDLVQREIKKLPFGELLVGHAILVTLENKKFKQLLVAPTMRTPRRIFDYDDVYLAARAVFDMALKSNINSLVMPGLGSGVGGVPMFVTAHYMAEAYKWVLLQDKIEKENMEGNLN